MKSEQHKNEDALKKIFSITGLESPSVGFTSDVMEKVHNEIQSHPVSFKPVINRKGWVLVASIVLLLVILVVFFNPSEISWLPTIHLSDIQFPDLIGSKMKQVYEDPVNNRIFTLILLLFIPILTLVGCDYLVHKYREKDLLGLF